MSRMHRWVKALALVYGLAGSAQAAETAWTVPAPAAPDPGGVTLGRPVPISGVTLDRPVPIGGGSVSPVAYGSTNAGPVARGQTTDPLPPVGLSTVSVSPRLAAGGSDNVDLLPGPTAATAAVRRPLPRCFRGPTPTIPMPRWVNRSTIRGLIRWLAGSADWAGQTISAATSARAISPRR